MKRLLAVLLMCAASAFAQDATRTIHVWVDANAWNSAIMLKQLNEHGAGKHWQFLNVAPGESYDYRITVQAQQNDVQTVYGPIRAHDSIVTVYDSQQELFSFTKSGKWTEGGASNAASKEIIKRMSALRER